MLGEPSAPAAYWEHVGRLAIAQGVERIVMMVSPSYMWPVCFWALYSTCCLYLWCGCTIQGAHWHIDGDYFGVATNPKPDKEPVAW